MHRGRRVQERCPVIPVLFLSGYAGRCAAFENPGPGTGGRESSAVLDERIVA